MRRIGMKVGMKAGLKLLTQRVLVGALLVVAHASVNAQSPHQSPQSTAALQAQIERLAPTSGGVVGVAAWRLDGKGPRILLNGSEAFPMASTFKVAVAGTILAGVDSGRLKLDQMVPVEPDMLVPSDVIAENLIHPGISLSVYNLLELMLTHSDNTATDVLQKLAGGGEAVTAWLRKQGVEGQRIDRDTHGLLRDFFGVDARGLKGWEEAAKANPGLEARGDHPLPSFDNDPRDSSTPEAMGQLLTLIYSGQALSADSTQVLRGIMERCRTGAARLKGLLPAGTVVAHKTGTIGGTVNDVGVMTLPGDAGQVVIAVFVKKSDLPYEKRERAIAEIARSVYDFYLFNPAS